MLHHKAGQVSARGVPPSLLGRARLRIMRNAAIVGTTAVVLVGAAFIGVQALNSSEPTRPIPPAASHSPRPTPRRVHITASPVQPTSIPECTSGQLRAVGTLEGAAGSREGAIAISNFSDKTCTLQGTLTITLLDQNLSPITSGVSFSSSPAGWEADASPTPPGWPVVTLAPGDAASVRLRWSNWCPDGRDAPLWRMEIPNGGSVDVMGLDAALPPPCNGPDQPSTIEVGTIEPGPSR
jgi:uncharacterized protein DUF4232